MNGAADLLLIDLAGTCALESTVVLYQVSPTEQTV